MYTLGTAEIRFFDVTVTGQWSSVAESSRADEASIVLLQLSSSGLSKTTIGVQSEQRIGSVWGFCKEFEDRLDFKCNLREVTEVHVSRNL